VAASATYRVWCLTWAEDESHGMNVSGYDAAVESKRTDRETIWVPAWNLESAKEAAEEYAAYVHSQRDGWESNWPLEFRVRLPDGTTEDYEVERDMEPIFRAARKRS